MKTPIASLTTRALRALVFTAGLAALPASAQTVFILTTDGKLASAPTANPAAVSGGLTITGVDANETLVAIDVRPQTQRLYALGVNATADTATLYHVSPETGFAAVVGAASSIAFTTDGVTVVDFPDPATTGWDIDFNPAVDRLRIVAGSLNFRVNPNNGAPVDGNNGGAAVAGTNPDGAMNGGTTTVNATAYTNSQPNNGNIATQYTLDATTNSLYIQNPPNGGTQTGGQPVTLGGNPLDFSGAVGFDIVPGVNAPASNTPVTSGSGFALLTVGGTGGLYSINLVNGQATLIGPVAGRSLAFRQELGAAIALSADGANLIRFSTSTPGTITTQPLGVPGNSETLVGIDFRPQTGQLYGLGVNALTNFATLYLIDPQTGTLTVVGGTGSIAYVDASSVPIDLPDPAMTGYGMDFNPTVDRLRVVTGSGLNFRINPNTGGPVDGNTGAAGTQPDVNIGGFTTGVDGTAYVNSYPQPLMTGVTTQYTIDSGTDTLNIQNPPNNGTQTLGLPLTLGGNPLNLASANGLDIPAPVTVTTANSVAKGHAWLVGAVGGVTSLYTLDLQTGAATSAGLIGGGGTALAGLIVNATASLGVEFPAGTAIYDGLTAVDHGTVDVESSSIQAVTLTNTGSQALTYTTTLNVGTAHTVTAGNTGTIPPGGTATLELTFNPLVTGVFDDVLHILSNDAAVPSFEIVLSGFSILPLTEDAITTTSGSTRFYVLANDGLSDAAIITSVSDPAIQIDASGRYLIIPAGFTGSFTYTTNDNGVIGQATANVTAGMPVVGATVFNGLLFDESDNIVGFGSIKLKNGVATVALSAGTAKTSAKIDISSGVGSAFTSLGNVTLVDNLNGTYGLFISALGGAVGGALNAAVPTAPAAKHHIALASPNPAFPGGGFAVATTSSKGAITLKGTLPDGVKFSAATALRDNGSYAFFVAVTKGPKPPAFVGGELVQADLGATDVTGQLEWSKLPQVTGAKGLHLGGVETTLDANGSLYTGAPLATGAGTLTLSGGNLAGTEVSAVTVTGGVPTVAGSLVSWTGVKASKGTFKASVTVTGLSKPTKGSGLYLPKSNSAFGYFPGTAVGGKIRLTVP